MEGDEATPPVEITRGPVRLDWRRYLNFTRDDERLLFETAGQFAEAGHTDSAVVVAQTAVELVVEGAFDVLLHLEVPDPLAAELAGLVPDRTFMDKRTRSPLDGVERGQDLGRCTMEGVPPARRAT